MQRVFKYDVTLSWRKCSWYDIRQIDSSQIGHTPFCGNAFDKVSNQHENNSQCQNLPVIGFAPGDHVEAEDGDGHAANIGGGKYVGTEGGGGGTNNATGRDGGGGGTCDVDGGGGGIRDDDGGGGENKNGGGCKNGNDDGGGGGGGAGGGDGKNADDRNGCWDDKGGSGGALGVEAVAANCWYGV